MHTISFEYEGQFYIVAPVEDVDRSVSVTIFEFTCGTSRRGTTYVAALTGDEEVGIEIAAEALKERGLHGLFVSKGEMAERTRDAKNKNPRGNRYDWETEAAEGLIGTDSGYLDPSTVGIRRSVPKKLLKQIETAVNAALSRKR